MRTLFFLVSVSVSLGQRNAYKQPFASNSIWNLPIGVSAKYVAANIRQANAWGMTIDPDLIVLKPSSPITNVCYNGDGWSGKSRCDCQGATMFQVPFPPTFIVPGANSSNTPNYAGAILLADNTTILQSQPWAHCTESSPLTSQYKYPSVSITGGGIEGAHGGSGLSSIGGTVRLGELVPGAPNIPHALKINLDAAHDCYPGNPSFRWPAVQADSCAPGCYGGKNPSVMPGSLLALPTSLNISAMGFETVPGKMLAWTFQNYGAYIVDDTAWDVYAIETEFSPDGDVSVEFEQKWGFSMTPQSKNDPWARDMDRIFLNLAAVDNWNEALYNTVSTSSGSQGTGGGKPLQPWAPSLS